MRLKNRGTASQAEIVRVTRYAAVAVESISGAKKVPFLHLDLSARPDIVDFFLVHSEVGPGDAQTSWAAIYAHKDRLYLHVRSDRPSRVRFLIELQFENHGGVIFGIDHSKLVYLKAASTKDDDGSPEDRFHGSIVLEVAAANFPVDWLEWYRAWGYQHLKRIGMPRKIAKSAAEKIIEAEFSFWESSVDFQSDAGQANCA